MVLWLSTDNAAYNRAIYEIETAKADLIRLKLDLSRNEETRVAAQASLELIETNREYLRKYAKTVSMAEWTRLEHMRAGELEILIFTKNAKPGIERAIKITEETIERLSAELPSLKTKVLEFKRRG